MKKIADSPLWNSILKSKAFKNIPHDFKLGNAANLRIAQYNPKTHGTMFLKMLIFWMANSFKENDLLKLSQICNKRQGGGASIFYSNMWLDLDYLMALEEVLFLNDHLTSINSILEIGAGYGRTCHTILSLFPNIEKYTIVDLDQTLDLSRSYLNDTVMQKDFKKIDFVSINNFMKRRAELTINIDSMQEMSHSAVKAYLKYIDDFSRYFYCKNTVGKFAPKLCGFIRSKDCDLALRSGLLTDQLNIFCPLELEKHRKKFLVEFSPGKGWFVEKAGPTFPWSHYYQALFSKNA
ncbi:MAG: putative sugar O-methyltransferase [Holosporales bacterium]|jgi:putative sugar O-methyltransferase|nr:putative sugar O-methyltransferase [Holosporales bacterium]